MMGPLRSEVLKCFKKLHRTRKYIFNEDVQALQTVGLHINAEFKKNKSIDDVYRIQELVKLGDEVEKELRTTIIQAVEVTPGTYAAKINPETLKLDNVPYNDNAVLEPTGECPGKAG